MIVRRAPRAYRAFGPLPAFAAFRDAGETDVTVTEKTALKGLMFWVLGGVLTHIAIRWVDNAFYKEKS